MSISRRGFLAGAGVAATGLLRPGVLGGEVPSVEFGGGPAESPWRGSIPEDRFDPWIEVDPQALAFNVRVISRLVGGRPIMAVIKNNGYGLGLTTVGKILEGLPEVVGLAVVKELGPVFTALMVAGRAGSGICAEIGSMKVTRQIDALTVSAVNPMRYLVATRVVAAP